jgi:hypothetical protein
MPKPLSAAGIKLLNSQLPMLMEELALAEKYLFPHKNTVAALASRISVLRAIESGDAKHLGGKIGLQVSRESNLAREIEEEILDEIRGAIRNSKDTAFADRLLAALKMANKGKVSVNVTDNTTGLVILARAHLRRKYRRRPSWEEAQALVNSWRKAGLRDKNGTPPRELTDETWRRVRARVRSLF